MQRFSLLNRENDGRRTKGTTADTHLAISKRCVKARFVSLAPSTY